MVPAVLREGAEQDLPAGAADHLVRVLRVAVGRPLRVFDGRGAEFDATLIEAGKHRARVTLLSAVDAPPPSTLRITLAQSLARGEKMDLILQKATELGVAAIQPLRTERTEVRLGEERSERRMAHWRGVIIGACEQCGRADLPVLAPPLALPDWLAGMVDAPPEAGELRAFLDPASPDGIGAHRSAAAALVIAVGPEGGFADRELAAFAHARFQAWRVGPRVLRTETAGLAIIAIAQSRWGDLR